MFFETVSAMTDRICHESDLNMRKALAKFALATEAASIKMDENALKFTNESVDYDDLCLFNEETEEGLLGSFREAMAKVLEAIKKFFRDIKDKVVALFTDKKIDAQIAAVEKKVKLHPILKNHGKVSIPTLSKADEVDKRLHGKMLTLIAKIKGGSQVTTDDVNAECNAHKTQLQQAIMSSAKVVTIAAAIAAASVAVKNITKDIKAKEAADDDVSGKAAKILPDNAETKNALITITKNFHNAITSAVQRIIAYPSTIMTAVKEAVGGKKEVATNAAALGRTPGAKVKKALFTPIGAKYNADTGDIDLRESVDDFDFDESDYSTESAGLMDDINSFMGYDDSMMTESSDDIFNEFDLECGDDDITSPLDTLYGSDDSDDLGYDDDDDDSLMPDIDDDDDDLDECGGSTCESVDDFDFDTDFDI